jgi:hypothetical protein
MTAFALTSCIPLPVEGDLARVSVPSGLALDLAPNEKVVILGDNLQGADDGDAEDAAWCLRRFTKETAPKLLLLEPERFRKSVAPLLGRAGSSSADLSKAIAGPAAQGEIDELNLRYAIVAKKITTARHSEPLMHSSGEAFADAQIWDLQTGEMLGLVRAIARGAVLQPPNPLLMPQIDNETPACRGLGHQVGALLAE